MGPKSTSESSQEVILILQPILLNCLVKSLRHYWGKCQYFCSQLCSFLLNVHKSWFLASTKVTCVEQAYLLLAIKPEAKHSHWSPWGKGRANKMDEFSNIPNGLWAWISAVIGSNIYFFQFNFLFPSSPNPGDFADMHGRCQGLPKGWPRVPPAGQPYDQGAQGWRSLMPVLPRLVPARWERAGV